MTIFMCCKTLPEMEVDFWPRASLGGRRAFLGAADCGLDRDTFNFHLFLPFPSCKMNIMLLTSTSWLWVTILSNLHNLRRMSFTVAFIFPISEYSSIVFSF